MSTRRLSALLALFAAAALAGCSPAEEGLDLQTEQVESWSSAFPVQNRRIPRAQLSRGYQLHRVSWKSSSDRVTGVLAVPTNPSGEVPVVVMAHGLGSDKSMMFSFFGPALVEKNYAFLSFDLPHHGERKQGNLSEMQQLLAAFNSGVSDARRSADAVAELAEDFPLDTDRLAYIGYSLGSFIGIEALAGDERFETAAFCVLGVGYTEEGVFGEARTVTAAKNWQPKPVLMLNGRNDSVIPPDGSRKVYENLPEPKQIEWYDSGHILPPAARDRAVEFVVNHISSDETGKD